MTTMGTETRKHRSVSQINQFERCPMNYRLDRIDRVWKRPAAWLAQGSAFHEAAEVWEKSGRTATVDDLKEVFKTSYAGFINKSCEEQAPNLDWWFASGPYKGEVDIERRFNLGLTQVENFVQWHLAHADQEIWVTPDGTPAIELAFDIELDNVPIRGYIDAVRIVDGERRVVDYKTGANPGDEFQLAVYAVALAEMFDIEPPKWGSYWMAKNAKETYPFDLTEWTREKVSARFQELERSLAAGIFEPKPDPNKCKMCDVSLSCVYRAD